MNTFFKDFEDFEDFFELGFGRPTRFVFNTAGLKDQMPACWKKIDGGYRARVKTLGVERVTVTVEEYGIKVTGENKLYDNDYNTTIELPIAEDVMDNVVEIKHKTVAGLTFIELLVDRPKKKKIKIVEECA